MRAPFPWILAFTTLVPLLSLIGGCGRSGPIKADPSATIAGGSGAESESNCDAMLANALGTLQPDRLGITTDRAQVADLLNQWMPKCGSKEVAPVGPEATRRLGAVLPADELEALNGIRFTGRDVDHIRSCALLKAAGDAAIESAADDRERVVRLFDWVVRQIALTSESGALPTTAYEIALFGRGAAEDRAWVFAELLRQLRIDAVIVRPKTATEVEGAPDEAGGRWLVGVLLDEPEKPVLLFDMRLGWAVPAADDPGGVAVARPATLADAAGDPAVLQRLAVDEAHPYPLSADGLKSVTVEAIIGPDLCRPRMEVVQNALPATHAMVIYDPLDDTPSATGLVSRIAGFGNGFWTRDEIAVWPYVERQARLHENPDERQAERLKIRRRPFEAPAIVQEDDQGVVRIVGSRKIQWQTRIAQLEGDLDGALRSFQIIRLDSQTFQKDPRRRVLDSVMHARAEEDAFLWTGVCQHDLGEFSAAIATFESHLARYPGSEWNGHALRLWAESFARSDKLAAAIQVLNRIPESDLGRDGLKILQNRLRAARQKAGES